MDLKVYYDSHCIKKTRKIHSLKVYAETFFPSL